MSSIIRERRRATGLKQYELAYRANLSPTRMCYIEKGEVIPDPGTLRAIADALGCQVDDLKPPPPATFTEPVPFGAPPPAVDPRFVPDPDDETLGMCGEAVIRAVTRRFARYMPMIYVPPMMTYLHEMYPFWSAEQIDRILDYLEEVGVIASSRRRNGDRTSIEVDQNHPFYLDARGMPAAEAQR